MHEKPRIEGIVNHFETGARESILNEEELFNTSVAETPALSEAYRHLTFEDWKILDRDFTTLDVLEFQFIEREQWDSLDDDILQLKDYLEKREDVVRTSGAEVVEKLKELKEEFAPTIESFMSKIN